MQIKRYRAQTIDHAITKVKNALGPDAMIVSTKELKETGETEGVEIVAVQAKDYNFRCDGER